MKMGIFARIEICVSLISGSLCYYKSHFRGYLRNANYAKIYPARKCLRPQLVYPNRMHITKYTVNVCLGKSSFFLSVLLMFNIGKTSDVLFEVIGQRHLNDLV